MKPRILILSLIATTGTVSAADASASSAPSPAKITNPVKEAELATITLQPEATARLGVATVVAERKVVPAERLYGGEVSLPLAVPSDPNASTALFALAQPQTAAELLKLAELQAVADGEVTQAKVKYDAAGLTLERAEKLLANQTGSERAVDDARATRELTKAALDQATSRRNLLGPGFAASADGKRWWVRVAIPASDAQALDPDAAADIRPQGAQSDTRITAKRIANAPRTANATAATVDWYYELEDPKQTRRPGERVEVRLPLAGSTEERLVVPWASVLHDIHGGQWVYENTAPNVFVRRRVQTARVSGANAVLSTGPAPGAKIVTTGAAELFGTEFGVGK